jgi:SM-20-related protein
MPHSTELLVEAGADDSTDHRVIDPDFIGFLHWQDFCDPALLALARDATLRNREKFVSSTVTTGDAEYRKSRVCWHYDYQDLYAALSARLRALLPDIIRAFPDVPLDPEIEMQMTSHGEGDYFKWHNDNASPDTANRVLTYVCYFNLSDEKRFSGGELIIEVNGSKYQVQPTHNTIILFPSCLSHEVLPVHVPSGQWEDSRMTLNGWLRRI